MVKGILKRYSLPGMNRSEDSDAAAAHSPLPKRVSFDGAEPASVFEADEWDRSPAEVTLKLTYKDVIELRQLNVSSYGMGPLAMARTPSRRPTRQRTTTPQLPASTDVKTSPMQHCSPGLVQTIADKSSSPVFGIRVPPPSPTYQSFPSNSLTPLSEDTSCGDDEAPSSDPYYEEDHSTFHSGSPPGLPVRTPRLKGHASSRLLPPSPLRLPSSLPPRAPSPKPTTSPSSPSSPTTIPLYRHPRVRSKTNSVVMNHGSNMEASSPMPVIFPSLTHQASVPDKLSLSFNKLTLGTEHIDGRDSPSPTWKPTELAGMDVVESNSSSKPIPNKDVQAYSSLSYPTTPVVTRKTGKGLMGWELKRSSNAYGKFGFGRIRQQSV